MSTRTFAVWAVYSDNVSWALKIFHPGNLWDGLASSSPALPGFSSAASITNAHTDLIKCSAAFSSGMEPGSADHSFLNGLTRLTLGIEPDY